MVIQTLYTRFPVDSTSDCCGVTQTCDITQSYLTSLIGDKLAHIMLQALKIWSSFLHHCFNKKGILNFATLCSVEVLTTRINS